MEHEISAMKAILTRCSCRAFTDVQVTDDEMRVLTAAALAAPSAMNAQPWRVVVVQNKDLLNEMETDIVAYFEETNDTAMVERLKSRNMKVYYDAPTVMFFPIADTVYSKIDCGIICENVALAATALGLSSVIIGMNRVLFMGSKAEYWAEKLQFPTDYIYGVSIAIGHGDPSREFVQHLPDSTKVITIQ